MALQKVDNVYDLEWAPGVKYREVRLREEIEQSKYAFGQVEVCRRRSSRRITAICSNGITPSARSCWVPGWCWPALEECLKCSHLFNILDSSGSIGVTERTAYILRVRQLAIAIARAYVEGLARAGRGILGPNLSSAWCGATEVAPYGSL